MKLTGQKLNNDNCQCESKMSIAQCACEEDYVWNPSACAYECDKDCDIFEYLKYFRCMKSFIDDLEVICDEIEDIPEKGSANPSYME